jgi:hypothetical protein
MKLKFISLLVILLHISTVSLFANSDTIAISKTYYRSAMKGIEAMLDGKEPLSYEKAIYLIENAYNDNQISPDVFASVLDYNTGVIRDIAASNRVKPKEVKSESLWDDLRKYRAQEKGYTDKAKMNWAIFTFMTDTAYSVKQGNFNFIVHKEPFRYSTKDPLGTIDWANTQVTHLLQYGDGNCFALASLFKIFSERLNSDADICTAPGHLFITHKDDRGTQYNIELSNGTFPGNGTLETLTYTTDEAVKKGISMRQLDLKQSVSLCLVYLAKGYEYKFKTKGDEFALECAKVALKYDSLNLNAMLLKAEVLETGILNKGKTIAQLQADKTFKEYEGLITKLYNSGYREMPFEMKNLLIKGWTRDSTVNIITKEHTPKTFDHLGVQYNRFASLSWGLFDEDITNKPTARYSRTIYDTKKGRIKEFVKEEVLYNDYNFDPVVFAWNVDPMAHKMPGWSPYAAFADNPILNFDPDGAFPYTFHVRAFAPPDVFKPTDFHDDHRGYSTRTDVTSRIKQNFTIDPTARTYSGGKPTSDPTIWHGTSKTAHDAGGISKPDFGTNSFGSSTAAVTSEFEGSNPFFYGAAPNIHVASAISVSENVKNHTLNVSIDLSSKQFPATEAFIQDASGNSVFLGGAPAIGDPSDLMSRDMSKVSSLDLTIGINDKGEFQNVRTGGKTYTIDEYNKQATAQPAVQQEKK